MTLLSVPGALAQPQLDREGVFSVRRGLFEQCLEDDLSSELNVECSPSRNASRCTGLLTKGRAGDAGGWVTRIENVEDVEHISTQLEGHLLIDLRVLHQGRIHIIEFRSAKLIRAVLPCDPKAGVLKTP